MNIDRAFRAPLLRGNFGFEKLYERPHRVLWRQACELTLGVSGSQRAALKLSAGSPCDLTASDENDVVNVNAVPRSNGEPDDIGARVDLHAVARLAHDDESLFRIMRGTDGGARRNVTIRVENRAFDVQRIMVRICLPLTLG